MSLTVRIRKRFGAFALEADFTADSEPLALLGASGCGKSVTLKCIAGIIRPDEGHIELDGTVLYDSDAKIDLPPQKRRVGYLFQQYALFPNMTVAQNLAVAVADKARRDAAVETLLRRFHLSDVAALRPRQLSGGQQQRTAMARLLASQPRAILLDEPFAALDSFLKYQLELELSQTLADFDGPVVWVSHDRGEVWRNCPQVCVMDAGRSQAVQSMHELFHAPETVSAARLSGCKNFVSAAGSGSCVRLTPWNAVLRCAGAVPQDITAVGLRSHHVCLAEGTEENLLSCTVAHVIDDVFETIVLLRVDGSAPDAPLLRMELPKERWQDVTDKTHITVTVAPQNVLLLRG